MMILGFRKGNKHESGSTLIEALLALALLGATAVIFLGGLATISKATFLTDERSTAASLAHLQMESAKAATYVYGASQYSPVPIPNNKDYLDYSVVAVTVEPLRIPDDGIQRITVIINRSGEPVFRLESYKVDR